MTEQVQDLQHLLIEEIENAIIIAKSAGCSNADIIFAVEQLLTSYSVEA